MGTPLIHDPGKILIDRVIAQGFPVIPVPGATAVAAALSVAGMQADHFLFLWFFTIKI